MIINYTYYNSLLCNDICVAICYFNPLGYHKPLQNIQWVQKEFDKYHIPYYIIELVYPNQLPSIPNAKVVHSNSVLFSKENLWNLIEKDIPEKFTKVIFMDADIFCSDPDWFNKTSSLLDSNDLVHCMDYLYKDIEQPFEQVELDTASSRYSIIKAVKNQQELQLHIHHTGYVIAVNRSFLHKLGGVFEYGITGYGDTLFWSAFLKDFEPFCDNFLKAPRFKTIRKYYEDYKQNALSISSLDRIQYLPNANILHLRHGKNENRKYAKRNFYVSSIFDLYHNDDGVLEIKVNNPNSKDLIQYWIDRKEDE
jgi:hypothetical protein